INYGILISYKSDCVLTSNKIFKVDGQQSQQFVQMGYRFPVFFILRRYGHFFALFQFILPFYGVITFLYKGLLKC
ncbi:MAG TPA: hypothetical protein VLM43_03765, partial [Desulfobacterales bacterium]|nr:hypothetical protein [Desulfobacterales bacterium]